MPPARWIAVAVLVLAAFAAAGWLTVTRSNGAGRTALSWRVDRSPFALHIERGGKELVADATGPAGPGSRLSWSLASGARHTVTKLEGSSPIAGGTLYRLRTDEPGRTATLEVARRAHSVHVSWRLVPESGVDTVYAAFRDRAKTEHFVGTGIQHTSLDLSGQLVQLKVAYSCARSVVTPFFASSAGYGIWFDTTAVGHMQFRGTHDGMACDDSNSANPLCAVVGAGDRVQACFKTPRLDYDVFAGTPAQVVARYRLTAGRMPVPPKAEFGAIKWRDRVTGPSELHADVAAFRRLGIPLTNVLLDNPWEQNGCWGTLRFDDRFGDPAALVRSLRASGVGLMVWVSPWVSCTAAGFGGKQSLETPQGWKAVDYTDPAARAVYEKRIAELVREGVAGFKGDRGDETDLESLTFAGGAGREVHNVFPELFARSVLHAAGSPTPVTMFRAGYTGTPTAGAGVWTGDQTPDFAGMRDAIHSLASLGASGFAIAGSDVGGYATQTGRKILTPEVFARWTQLGAISPIFEVGGADRAQQFWKLGAEATAVARASITLHYELFPYLYGLARASSATGAPILQPVALQYPDDEAAWRADLELLVGRDLLAAPVTSQTRTPLVYLPKGSWVDLYAGRTVAGGQSVVRRTPLSQFPLYLRAGATIPFNARTDGWPVNALTVPGRSGWLTSRSSVTVPRTRQTTVLFVGRRRPSRITVDGRSARWVWTRAPFPGALVTLPPGAGRVTVAAS